MSVETLYVRSDGTSVQSCLSTDLKPDATIGSHLYFTDKAGKFEMYGGVTGWVSVDELGDASVVPTIAAVATSEVSLLATAGEVIMGRFTVNAPDDATAAIRLMNKQPDCEVVMPGETVSIKSSASIIRIDFVGVADVTVTAGNVIDTNESVLANVTSAMLTFDFLSSDIVKKADITLSNTWAAGVEALMKIGGRSYV